MKGTEDKKGRTAHCGPRHPFGCPSCGNGTRLAAYRHAHCNARYERLLFATSMNEIPHYGVAAIQAALSALRRKEPHGSRGSHSHPPQHPRLHRPAGQRRELTRDFGMRALRPVVLEHAALALRGGAQPGSQAKSRRAGSAESRSDPRL